MSFCRCRCSDQNRGHRRLVSLRDVLFALCCVVCLTMLFYCSVLCLVFFLCYVVLNSHSQKTKGTLPSAGNYYTILYYCVVLYSFYCSVLFAALCVSFLCCCVVLRVVLGTTLLSCMV